MTRASDAPKGLLLGLKGPQIILLENLRFEDGEAVNSREFAQQMASYVDVYVNDAFGASHRAHASIEALPSLVPEKGIGFLIAKEIEYLDRLLHAPQAPFMAILGGSKVSDKIPVIENMIDLIDVFFVGGAMAYTFLAAQKVGVGSSRVEKDKVAFASEMMARIAARDKRLLLPVDHVIAKGLGVGEHKTTEGASIPDGWLGVDIGPKTRELYRRELQRAKTVFWNGPMGRRLSGTSCAEHLWRLRDIHTPVGGRGLELLELKKVPGVNLLRIAAVAAHHVQRRP